MRRLLEDYNGSCWLCREALTVPEGTLDHILPRSWGGTRRYDNLAPAHEECNNRRRSRLAASDVRTGWAVLRNEKTGRWEFPECRKRRTE